jgi:glycine/D-amino acid oxidase-like deaminating enzyme
VDVCIVGAGFTGLWTAYYLLVNDPDLRVLLVEREIAGFGASGRNGGWCSALFPTSTAGLIRRHGPGPAEAMRRAMRGSVDEVGRVVEAEKIDADWQRGGTVVLARSPTQLDRARRLVAEDAARGGWDDLQLLGAAQAGARVGADGVLGGTFTPHCARVQPAALVRGLAETVERLGGRIVEQTPVPAIEPGGRSGDGPRVVTAGGTVRARWVIRATEAWTATLPGSRRAVAPVYSLMIATRPLPPAFWDAAGLASGETFADGRHLIIYGRRTADDRLAFGGRGAPYHAGSRVEPAFDRSGRVHRHLLAVLHELFPALRGEPELVTHAWGGPVGIARDWHASVGLDRATGLGHAGGYVGDGLGCSNLAGRTLADLILGRDSELTRLPWVGHLSRLWEPEPLRWLEINASLLTMTTADPEERLTGRPSLTARLLAPFLGH